jgi:hypothetical protein
MNGTYLTSVFLSIIQAVKLREESNPQFSFLFDLESPEGQYYRWRTYGATLRYPFRCSCGSFTLSLFSARYSKCMGRFGA